MARKSRKGTNVTAATLQRRARMRIWNAALYIRLSVEFNSGRGDSLETQRQIMEAHIALYPDIEIKKVYTDNGTTGQNFEREAFQRMLADIEAGKIDCVVVKDLSRLGRNAIDTGFYIEKYFPLHKVRFISVNDQYDSEEEENSGSHIVVPLKNIINEAYCADISKKIRSQQHQAMLDGDYIGSRPPYGYKKDPKNCHKLLVNEDTAPYVRQIFNWIAEGVPLYVVVKRLNEQAVPTPGYYLASIGLLKNQYLIGSGKWQTRSLNRILGDEVYLGDMVQGKTTSIHRKQHEISPENWIVVRGTHEAIITRELFDRVQEIRRDAANRNCRKERIPYSESILRGRVFCGHCGKNLHRERNTYRYYYSCISNQRIEEHFCPGGRIYIREEHLFDAILTIIRKEAETVIGNKEWLDDNSYMIEEKKTICNREVSRLLQEAEKNKKFHASLYDSFIEGVLTKQEYSDMKVAYAKRIDEALRKAKVLQMQQQELEQQVNRYLSLADLFYAVDQDTKLSSSLVKQVIQRITVYSQDNISVEFAYSGFEQLAEVLSHV